VKTIPEYETWTLKHLMTGWSHLSNHVLTATRRGVRVEAEALGELRKALENWNEVLRLQDAMGKGKQP
jgi:hypothetical protein